MDSSQRSNFEKLLIAREEVRVLRAKEKWLDDLVAIESKSKLEPFPSGSFETFQSHHIWEDVLSYVKPSDISSLKASCITFRNLMERKEVLLMTEALKIVKDKGYLEAEEMTEMEHLRLMQDQLNQRFQEWHQEMLQQLALPQLQNQDGQENDDLEHGLNANEDGMDELPQMGEDRDGAEQGQGDPLPAAAGAPPFEEILAPQLEEVNAHLHQMLEDLNQQHHIPPINRNPELQPQPQPPLVQDQAGGVEEPGPGLPFEQALPILQHGIVNVHEMLIRMTEAIQEQRPQPPAELLFELNRQRVQFHLDRRRFRLQLLQIQPEAMNRRREVLLRPRIMYKFTFLKMRLISKDWKEAAEEAFMNKFCKEWYLDITPLLTVTRPNSTKIIILDRTDMDFATFVLESTKCAAPMIQILEIYEFSEDNVDNFTQELSYFLQKYGAFVKALIINWSGITHCSPNTKYWRLSRLLTRMPNLKALIMRGDADGFPTARPPTKNERSRRPPFPPLEHLEVLSLEEGYTEDNTLLLEIFRKSTNLKSILIPSLINDGNAGEVMEAMKQLGIVYFQQNDWVFPEGSLATWPLKKFSARNCSVSGSDCAVFDKFKGTLEILELGLLTLDSKKFALKLTNLKVLCLGGIANEHLTGLDFLIPLEVLESLEFRCPQSFLSRNPSLRIYLIDIYEYVGKMEESNIWRCFVFLKKLHISGGVGHFSRSGVGDYVEYVKKNGVTIKK